MLDAGRTFTDGVSSMTPGDSSAVDELIDRAFDLTEKVLQSQRDFAKQVVQVATRPVTGTGRDAGRRRRRRRPGPATSDASDGDG